MRIVLTTFLDRLYVAWRGLYAIVLAPVRGRYPRLDDCVWGDLHRVLPAGHSVQLLCVPRYKDCHSRLAAALADLGGLRHSLPDRLQFVAYRRLLYLCK